MRRLSFIIAVGLMLSGCGRDEAEKASEAENASLLDPGTVNAILGAGIAEEELAPADAVGENAADEAGDRKEER